MEKKLDGNYTRMLQAILNKSCRQHPTKQQLYSHQPPITKTIKVRRTRHAGHCWRNKDELISDVLLWTTTHGQAKAGRPARTYIQQLCEDTGCSPEDLPEAMNNRKESQERVRDIRAGGMTRWWWYLGESFKRALMLNWHWATPCQCINPIIIRLTSCLLVYIIMFQLRHSLAFLNSNRNGHSPIIDSYVTMCQWFLQAMPTFFRLEKNK